MRFPYLLTRTVLALLILLAPSLWAQDGLRGAALGSGAHWGAGLGHFMHPLVAADFDSDQQPDGAVLVRGGARDGGDSFQIELHVTAGPDSILTFSSPETALSMLALDVNQDGTPDIVVETTFTHQRLGIWLNDGHGSFRKVKNEDYPSQGDSSFRWHRRMPLQCFPALDFPPRTPVALDSATKRLSGADDATHQMYWHRVILKQSVARAPNSLRGPPSLTSL